MLTDDASAPSIADAPLQTAAVQRLRARLNRLGTGLETLLEREREQLPLWLPVGLGLGISAWFWLPDSRSWSVFLFLAAAMFCAGLAGPAARSARAVSWFALAAAVGCALVWIKAESVGVRSLAHPRMAIFSARVETVQPLPAQEMTRLVVRPEEGSALPGRLRINIPDDKAVREAVPGAIVRVRAWLMPPAPMAVPGGYDFARVAYFQGIGGSGRAIDITLESPANEQNWRDSLRAWRQKLSSHIRNRLDGAPGGIAAALATGDQGAIAEEDAEAMRASGLAHLLSVSGLHLTAVVGAVMFLSLRLLALSPYLALRAPLLVISASVGAVAGVAYTVLTGAEVPTVRSCIAALLVLLGIALGREALTLRLVAVGALVVMLAWPESLAGPSFQLSFAAITAIVALHEQPRVQAMLRRRDEGPLLRLARMLIGLVLTGLAVELALTPIALFHFNKAGVYGALANILAIPLTTFVIMPMEGLALLFDLVGLGAPFWWIAGRALELLLRLAHATANAPGAVASLPAMPVGAFALMIGGGLWLLLWRTRWRRGGVASIALGACWAALTPAPDLLVTGDGRHLAMRTPAGSYALLRPRAGDYIRDLMAEVSGSEQQLGSIEDLAGARCNRDLCTADFPAKDRRWRITATRSSLLVPSRALQIACRNADIVVSDRLLPASCRPRWLKADRRLLLRTGGLAITLGRSPRVESVTDRIGHHPWAPEALAAARWTPARVGETRGWPATSR